MTADTTPSLSARLAEMASMPHVRFHYRDDVELVKEAASYITELEGERRSIIANIPMDYLKAHDVAGATGPTASLDLVGAMRAYSEARWRIIDRCKEAEARAEAAEANARRLETGVAEIMAGCVSGDVGGEDVVWFSAIETLWERCAHLITPNSTAEIPQTTVVADILAALTTKEADR